jgi:hypothetical protein
MMLHGYWFSFRQTIDPSALNLGCGITAYDEEDARAFLRDKVFPVYGSREILEVTVDVDISTLEKDHVRSNMGLPTVRGVWFPILSSGAISDVRD